MPHVTVPLLWILLLLHISRLLLAALSRLARIRCLLLYRSLLWSLCSLLRLGWLLLRLCILRSVFCCVLALRKFLFLYHHVCRVHLLSVLTGIASGLNPSGDSQFCALPKILSGNICLPTKYHAWNKVCRCLPVTFKSAVHCQCIPGYCCSALSGCVPDIRILCQSSH